MDQKNMEENGMRTRSFRFEDSNNRRVFLRSYPLQWGEEEEQQQQKQGTDEEEEEEQQQQQQKQGTDEETVKVNTRNTEKKPIKKLILSVFHWGEEKFLILRRFKNKLTVYVIACVPISFKRPTALISA